MNNHMALTSRSERDYRRPNERQHDCHPVTFHLPQHKLRQHLALTDILPKGRTLVVWHSRKTSTRACEDATTGNPGSCRNGFMKKGNNFGDSCPYVQAVNDHEPTAGRLARKTSVGKDWQDSGLCWNWCHLRYDLSSAKVERGRRAGVQNMNLFSR